MAPPLSLRYRGGCQPPKRARSALWDIAYIALQDCIILYNSVRYVNKEIHMFYSLLELMVWGRKSRTYKRWIYGKRRQQRTQPIPRVQLYGLPVIYLASK